MFVGVPSSGKTILTWTGNKRDILGQLILTSLSSSVKFIHIFLLFPKNTVNIEGGSLFNFTHLWNNHPYHEAQGLVRKRGGGIGQSLERWQHQYPIVNPIQSNPTGPSPSCCEPVLQPGRGRRHAAPATEAALHPCAHHGPCRLRHHVLLGDHHVPDLLVHHTCQPDQLMEVISARRFIRCWLPPALDQMLPPSSQNQVCSTSPIFQIVADCYKGRPSILDKYA